MLPVQRRKLTINPQHFQHFYGNASKNASAGHHADIKNRVSMTDTVPHQLMPFLPKRPTVNDYGCFYITDTLREKSRLSLKKQQKIANPITLLYI